MTRCDIIKAVQEGSRDANKKYERWTRGWWLHDSGVEGLLVAGIAEGWGANEIGRLVNSDATTEAQAVIARVAFASLGECQSGVDCDALRGSSEGREIAVMRYQAQARCLDCGGDLHRIG